MGLLPDSNVTQVNQLSSKPGGQAGLDAGYINSTLSLETSLQAFEQESQSFAGSLMGRGLLFENINATYWNQNFPYVLSIFKVNPKTGELSSSSNSLDVNGLKNFGQNVNSSKDEIQ